MEKSTPVVSIVIPWCNRLELRTSMLRNLEAFQSLHSEVLVVNCGGDQTVLQTIADTLTLDCIRIIEIFSESFNKCLALNIGALMSRAPRLLFLDADIVVSPDVVCGMASRADENSFVTMQWVVDSSAKTRSTGLDASIQTMELVWKDGLRISLEFFRSRAADQARGGPGLICLLKEHFIAVGGMNSRLTRWGWEDLDLIIRLQAVHGIQRVLFGEAEHLSHDDAGRNVHGTTRQESMQHNMALCYANYGRGNFLGTLKRDLYFNRDKTVEHELHRINNSHPCEAM